MVVECRFGRSKGRLDVLRKDIDTTDLKSTLNILYVCIGLHNFCDMNKEQR